LVGLFKQFTYDVPDPEGSALDWKTDGVARA
jgi:hypothetical protein